MTKFKSCFISLSLLLLPLITYAGVFGDALAIVQDHWILAILLIPLTLLFLLIAGVIGFVIFIIQIIFWPVVIAFGAAVSVIAAML